MAAGDEPKVGEKEGEPKKKHFFQNVLSRIQGPTENEKPSNGAAIRDATAQTLFDDATEMDASTRVWARAYQGLQTSEKELMETYEKILHEQASGTWATSTLAKATLVLAPDIFAKANAHNATRLFSLREATASAKAEAEKHAQLEEGALAAAEFVKKMEDTISAALTAYPLAGMVWSGLCAAAPYVTQLLTSRKDMRDGLEHVLDQLEWYMDLTRVLLRKNWDKGEEFSRLQGTLESSIVKLYQKLVLYQVHVTVEVFHANKLVKALKVYLGRTDWAKELEDLKALEEFINKRVSQGLKVEVAEHLRGLSSHMISINQTLMGIKQGNEAEHNRLAAERHAELIGKFKALDYEYVMKMNPRRVEGTCEWFCQHPGFKSWLNGTDKIILVSADPGCGKSVLAKYLVEDFLPQERPQAAICYFFFKEQFKTENREPTAALCSILHCLFTQRPQLVEMCDAAVRQAGDRLQSDFTSLWDIFEQVVTHKDAGPVVIVLDALDECNFAELERFLKRINMLLSRAEKVAPVKFLCTTRGYPRIFDMFDAFSTSKVRLSGDDKANSEKIQKEIGLVVKYRLNRLAKPPRSLGETQLESIRQALKGNGQVQRTYLWVKLMFDALEEEVDNAPDDLATLVGKLPQTLSGVYETLLRRVKDDNLEAVRTILRLLIAATRPLSLRELNTALKVRSNMGVKNEAALHLVPDDSFRRWLSAACGFFISVHNGHVYFIHLTAKEFLMGHTDTGAHADPGAPPKARWAHSITERDAQATMAESCIAYLSIRHFHGTFFTRLVSQAFDQWAFYGRDWGRYKTGEELAEEIMAGDGYLEDIHETRVSRTNVLDKYAFLAYVCGNWLDHFGGAQVIEERILVRDVGPLYVEHYKALFEGRDLSYQPWFRITLYLLLEAERFKLVRNEAICLSTARQLAAFFGHLRFLKASLGPLAHGSPADASVIVKDEALVHWASLGGSAECVKHLASWPTADSCLPLSNKAPLVWAAANGHIDALKTLINERTVNNIDAEGQNALLGILSLYSLGIIRLTDQRISARFRDIARLLCSLGADPKLGDKAGDTVLHHLRAGIDEVDPDVDVAVLDAACRALYPPRKTYHPKQKGNLAEVQVVPEFEDDPPAYHSRSFFDSELFLDLYDASILKCLLDHGASASARNNRGETPLHIASGRTVKDFSFPHPWNLLFLLHAGADIEAKDNEGRTPLFSAVRTQCVRRLRVLLAHGAKPNVRESSEGKAPLHLAVTASMAARPLTYHLLRNGADPNLPTQDGSTVLHVIAESFGVADGLLPILFDTGRVKVETKNKSGWTALHYAAQRGNLPMMAGLLERGANPNAQTRVEKKTALHLAIFERHPTKVIEKLVGCGAVADIPDADGQTPLHVLCSLRPSEHSSLTKDSQITIGRLLLRSKGRAEMADKEGRTAVSLARGKHLDDLANLMEGQQRGEV